MPQIFQKRAMSEIHKEDRKTIESSTNVQGFAELLYSRKAFEIVGKTGKS